MLSLRPGQQELVDYLPNHNHPDPLTVQWPTGYGKSYGMAFCWKYAYEHLGAERCLVVVANDTQRNQIIQDFAGDCKDVGAPCEGGIWQFMASASDVRATKRNQAQVFVVTIQGLHMQYEGGALSTLHALITDSNKKWCFCFDEIQHIAQDRAWGKSANFMINNTMPVLVSGFSATPYSNAGELIFPDPQLVVTYEEAAQGGHVKNIECEAYDYKITVKENDNEIVEYKTSELAGEVVSGSLNAWEERQNIRYLSTYIQPLITTPVDRLLERRSEYGVLCQMIIFAASCSHAKCVYEQLLTEVIGTGLKVDWMGSGLNGRKDHENASVRDAFCPPKKLNKETGERERPDPTLDILICVTMAGEGFDSINVTEVVDLYPMSPNGINGRAPQKKQQIGRGSRVIKNAPDARLTVSVSSDHPLAEYGGKQLNKWMDHLEGDMPELPPKKEGGGDDEWWPPVPKEREAELLTITKNERRFEHFQDALNDKGRREGILSPTDYFNVDATFDLYKQHRLRESAEMSAQMALMQLRSTVDARARKLAGLMQRTNKAKNGAEYKRFIYGVNAELKNAFGPRDTADKDTLQQMLGWLDQQWRHHGGN